MTYLSKMPKTEVYQGITHCFGATSTGSANQKFINIYITISYEIPYKQFRVIKNFLINSIVDLFNVK